MDDKATPENAEGLLGSVPDSQAFRLSNGGVISSLRQLYSALQSMDNTVFYHHVSGERNDFGNWVKDVHKDYRLANTLFSSGKRDECASAVGNRIYELEKSMETCKPKVMALPAPAQPAQENYVRKMPEAKPAVQEAPAKKESPAPQKSSGFNKEEQIAKAILERKPIDHLLEPRKKRESKPKPAPLASAKKEKTEVETAAERLEKILSDAAKAKMEESSRKIEKAEKPKPAEVKVKPEAIKAQPPEVRAPVREEPLFSIPSASDDSTEDVIRLIEEQSFAGQLKTDMKSIFSKDAIKDLAQDMKKIAPSRKTGGVPSDAVPAEAAAVAEKKAQPGRASEKDVILSHLKKVYGQ